ncbi:hypothetical protein ACP4OV_002255 [Aristida adscensionis]
MADAISPDKCKQLQLSQKEAVHDTIDETVVNIDPCEVKPEPSHGGANKEELGPEAHILKIHRFPSSLRRFGADGDYIAPWAVSLGPYHHGKPELQAMEEIKRKVVDYFFEQPEVAASQEAALEMMKPVARQARGLYADAAVLEGTTDDEFASMMFIDGCFLVQYMVSHCTEDQESSPVCVMSKPYSGSIDRDMLLLENQIPWPVIEFFMALRRGILSMGLLIGPLFLGVQGTLRKEFLSVDFNWSYKPSYLLDLFHFYLAGSSNIKKELSDPQWISDMQLTTSAAELEGMCVKLKVGQTTRLSDISIVKGHIFANLSLPPLSLAEKTSACCLVNMVALEMHDVSDANGVNSYLAILAQLMSQEDDVRELRARGIIRGLFADRQTLEFFSGLAPSLYVGDAYYRFIVDLAEYKHKRWLWIAVYRFFHNNAKIIATVLPIIGVLVGILKTLLSIKQKQQ